MAGGIEILGFERVKIFKKKITLNGSDKAEYRLKQKPDHPSCEAEISLQEISFWRNKPLDRYYGAHHMSVDLDSTKNPTKALISVQLRDQKQRKNDVWSYQVRALVIYFLRR